MVAGDGFDSLGTTPIPRLTSGAVHLLLVMKTVFNTAIVTGDERTHSFLVHFNFDKIST
ncbi:hypothetical protein KIN20_032170 [Parelaphostrongylus tenuis]|uniref:Uncharacterized protein n=1 Tax=Parelaphostrongylus tenuis TaxID=148309 RepID=A0AAD5WHV3_PARTN|nr:hypothetical protein KIN20_032170 [Parelaphostrongylus tenuis]